MSFTNAYPVTSPKDYYQALGVLPEASFREIEEAYWRLAKDPIARDRMPQLNEAYEVLSQSDKRLAYDEERRSGGAGGAKRRRKVLPQRVASRGKLWSGPS